jgi:hypothetical protein
MDCWSASPICSAFDGLSTFLLIPPLMLQMHITRWVSTIDRHTDMLGWASSLSEVPISDDCAG